MKSMIQRFRKLAVLALFASTSAYALGVGTNGKIKVAASPAVCDNLFGVYHVGTGGQPICNITVHLSNCEMQQGTCTCDGSVLEAAGDCEGVPLGGPIWQNRG